MVVALTDSHHQRILQEIEATGLSRQYPGGFELVGQGAAPGTVLLVETGSVAIGTDGHVVGPGALIGGEEVANNVSHAVSATTIEDCVIRHISVEGFYRLMHANPVLMTLLRRTSTGSRSLFRQTGKPMSRQGGCAA